MLGLIIAQVSHPVIVVPRGSTPATAKAADVHAHQARTAQQFVMATPLRKVQVSQGPFSALLTARPATATPLAMLDDPPPRRPIMTAEDVVQRIAAECAFVDERGGVGIRLRPGSRHCAAVRRPIPAGPPPATPKITKTPDGVNRRMSIFWRKNRRAGRPLESRRNALVRTHLSCPHSFNVTLSSQPGFRVSVESVIYKARLRTPSD